MNEHSWVNFTNAPACQHASLHKRNKIIELKIFFICLIDRSVGYAKTIRRLALGFYRLDSWLGALPLSNYMYQPVKNLELAV